MRDFFVQVNQVRSADVLYTMVTKKFVTSQLLHIYDVITCILASTWAQISDPRNSKTYSTDLA